MQHARDGDERVEPPEPSPSLGHAGLHGRLVGHVERHGDRADPGCGLVEPRQDVREGDCRALLAKPTRGGKPDAACGTGDERAPSSQGLWGGARPALVQTLRHGCPHASPRPPRRRSAASPRSCATDSSDASQATSPATSSPVPNRPEGGSTQPAGVFGVVLEADRCRLDAGHDVARTHGVRPIPWGAPRPRRAQRRRRRRPSSPSTPRSRGCRACPCRRPSWIMEPPPWSRIGRSTRGRPGRAMSGSPRRARGTPPPESPRSSRS